MTSKLFRSFRAILFALTLTGFLSLTSLGCDSGTQEPDAPKARPLEYGAADPDATPTEDPAPRSGGGTVDPSRLPTDLPEGIEAAVPSNFPSDITIYPGSSPAVGRGVDIAGSPLSAVQLVTNDSVSDVYDFYVNDLRSNGWEIGEGEIFGENTGVQATKGSCNANVMVAPADGGGTDIFLMTQC